MKQTNNKWKMEHNGNITMQVLMVIPGLLYFSKSVIKNPEKKTNGATVYSIHITPLFSLSFAWKN